MERANRDKDITEVRVAALKCLRCGKGNLPDNIICGYCGASLPLIYNRQGRVIRHKGGPVVIKVSPSVRKFTRLVILIMIANAVFMIVRWLKAG